MNFINIPCVLCTYMLNTQTNKRFNNENVCVHHIHVHSVELRGFVNESHSGWGCQFALSNRNHVHLACISETNFHYIYEGLTS